MPTGVHTQTDVPPNKVNTVSAGFKAQGAKVTTQQQPDGNYTVVATFPGATGTLQTSFRVTGKNV
jgi:hypothetical protein